MATPPPSPRRRLPAALLLAIAPLALAAPAHAASCDSVATVAVDLWDEYGKHATQLGCTVAAATTVAATSGASGDPDKTRATCLDNALKTEQLARQMIATWNRLAANRWATLGPRKLQLDATHRGTVQGPGTRLFVTPSPVTVDTIDVAFTKEDFRGPAEVTVCSHAPDGAKARRWNFTVERGDGNTGRLWLRRIAGVKGQLVSIHIVGKSVAKKLRYTLAVDPAAAAPRGPAGQVAADTPPPAAPATQAPPEHAPGANRNDASVASCQGSLPARPASLRRGIADARIARAPVVPAGIRQPASPRIGTVGQPAARNVAAFAPDGGWVVARGTEVFARGIPDEAYRKLLAYAAAGHAVDAIAFTPDGGWTVVVDGASWTRNVGGGYHDAVTALVADGRRVRSVAFNPADWRTRRGYVLAHDAGFIAAQVPAELCAKLRAYTAAGTPLDAVAFTPTGGWTIVAGDASWTRNVGGPAPRYHDTVTAAVAGGTGVHAVAFDPAGYDDDHGWLVVSDRNFYASGIPDEAEVILANTFGLQRRAAE